MSRSEPDPPPPYLVRRRERALDTRRRLIHAATRLWSEKDYDATTVEDICAAAGVGRTTYYLHFVSKEQLLGELAFATAGGVSSDVADAMDVGDLDSQLCAFIDGLVRRMESVPRSLTRLVLRHISKHGPGTNKPVDAVLFDHTLAEILDGARMRAEIADDADVVALAEVLSGTTMDALERWARGRTKLDLRESLQLRFNLVLHAPRQQGGTWSGSG